MLNDEQSRLLDQHYPDEPVEKMQTGLDNYLEHYNKQWSCQGLMMEDRSPYCMLKKALKLVPKKVRA